MYKGPKTTMYIVRSLNMVNWLCSHGFKILKVEDSEKDEKQNEIYFEESPALHHTIMANGKAAISQYFSNLIGEALKQYDCFYIDKYERLDKQNISTEHIDSAFLI